MTPRRASRRTIHRWPTFSRIGVLFLMSYCILVSEYSWMASGTGNNVGLLAFFWTALAVVVGLFWLVFQFTPKVGWYPIALISAAGCVFSVMAASPVPIAVFFLVMLMLVLDVPWRWTEKPHKWRRIDVLPALLGKTADRSQTAVAWGFAAFLIMAAITPKWQHMHAIGKVADLRGEYRLPCGDVPHAWDPKSRSLYTVGNNAYYPKLSPLNSIACYSFSDKSIRFTRVKGCKAYWYQSRIALSRDGRRLAVMDGEMLRIVDTRSGRCRAVCKISDHGTPLWPSNSEVGIVGSRYYVYNLKNKRISGFGKTAYYENVKPCSDGSGYLATTDDVFGYFDPKTGRLLSNLEGRIGCDRIVQATSRYIVGQRLYKSGDLVVADLQNPLRTPLVIRHCREMHDLSPDLRWYCRTTGGRGEWSDHAMYVGRTPESIRRAILDYVGRVR